MEKTQRQCEIVYVKQKDGAGWKWRAISGQARSSDEVYGLFYECVVAAREEGYAPAGVLSVEEARRRK
jgi:hypothetical protein